MYLKYKATKKVTEGDTMNPIGFNPDDQRLTASVSASTKKGLVKALFSCARAIERARKNEKKERKRALKKES